MKNERDYVLVEDDDDSPDTQPYAPAPPISCVRICVHERERVITLRSAPDYKPRRWPLHTARFVAASVLIAISLGLPLAPTIGVLVSTLVLVMLARRS